MRRALWLKLSTSQDCPLGFESRIALYSIAWRMVCDSLLAEDVTQGAFLPFAKNASNSPVASAFGLAASYHPKHRRTAAVLTGLCDSYLIGEMKLLLILVCGLAAGVLRAAAAPLEHQVEKNSTTPQTTESTPLKQPKKKTAEIQGKKFTLGGIFVKFAKTDKPLQLLNPAAPKKYANGEDAVYRDPKTGQPAGWKLFWIRW